MKRLRNTLIGLVIVGLSMALAGTAEAQDCGPCDGRVSYLKLEYLGNIDDFVEVYTKNTRDPKHLILSRTISDANRVFEIRDGDKLDNLGFFVNLQRDTEIHTSCSQPVNPGLIYGNFKILESSSVKGGPICPITPPEDEVCAPCEGRVSHLTLRYLGPPAEVEVYTKNNRDPKHLFFGPANLETGDEFELVGEGKDQEMDNLGVFVNRQLHDEIHTSCSQPVEPGVRFGDFLVIAGRSSKGGPLCPVDVVECPVLVGECKGGVSYLNLRYIADGIGSDLIEVYKDKNAVEKDLYFRGEVERGDRFEFVGPGPEGDMGGNIAIFVNKQHHMDVHTSCSQPIFPGLILNGFEIVSFASKSGGFVGPNGVGPPPRVTYEVVEEAGSVFVDITVTADFPLTVVSPSITSSGGPLELRDSDIGTFEAFFRYEIIDFRAYFLIDMEVQDACGACPDTDMPWIGTRGPLHTGATVAEMRVWGTEVEIDRPTADLKGGDGIWYFQVFNNDYTLQNFSPAVANPEAGVNFDPPIAFMDFDIVLDGTRHGSMAANRCNAFVGDPDDSRGLGSRYSGLAFDAVAELERPQELSLGENYPNPFNPATRIDFALPEASNISLVVYDVLGRQVAVLAEGYRDAGHHNVLFDASHLTSGTYFYELRTAETSIIRKMVLTK